MTLLGFSCFPENPRFSLDFQAGKFWKILMVLESPEKIKILAS